MLRISHRRMTPDESNFREWCKPERKAKNAPHFLRVWECLSIRLYPVLPVTNKQFFTLGKVHQTRLISLNLLSQVSVLLRTVHRGRCRSKSKLLLCRCMHLAFSAKLRRFACKPELKDDTQTEFARKASAPQWFGSTTKDPCRYGRGRIRHSSLTPPRCPRFSRLRPGGYRACNTRPFVPSAPRRCRIPSACRPQWR